MGSLSSSAAEWMEIKNSSANEVDLSGWEILNASGKIKITFSTGDALAPGGLLLLARGSSTPAEKTYSGDLVNTGDVLALMDPQCGISDYLDASNGWPDGNNTTKQTLERDADGVGWHTSALPGGTPGAKNSVVLAPTLAPSSDLVSSAPEESMVSSVVVSANSSSNTVAESDVSSSSVDTATSSVTSSSISDNASAAADGGDNNASVAVPSLNHILIAVVQIAGVGTSSSNDLVKLYNPTAAAIDISGWKLHKKSGTGADYSLKVFPAGSVIGAGQPFVWANSSGGFSETIGANVSSTETLAADNSVALMDAAGTIVDAVAWGTGTNQYGEGPPYPTSPGANRLLSRRSSDGVMVDTDNNSNDFTIQ